MEQPDAWRWRHVAVDERARCIDPSVDIGTSLLRTDRADENRDGDSCKDLNEHV